MSDLSNFRPDSKVTRVFVKDGPDVVERLFVDGFEIKADYVNAGRNINDVTDPNGEIWQFEGTNVNTITILIQFDTVAPVEFVKLDSLEELISYKVGQPE